MNLVVTGGRDYDKAGLSSIINILNPEVVFVGDCPTGADDMAREYCADAGVNFLVYRADWKKHGKAAGPIRNKEMLLDADKRSGGDFIVVAAPGGRGTENCIMQAREMGHIVLRIEP